ncbi:MAG: hypothetical protein EOP77_02430 [Variovorax sp.]|nr:MAG: hypothetical protein EOP77_02430 [Variovorax sp.]
MKWSLPAITLLVAISTAACGQSMEQPDIRFNPHPKMRYEITLKIEGIPGPLDAVEASAGYVVANEACVPLTPFIGATLPPEKRMPIVLTKLDDTTYRGEIYVDQMQDADYFGLGLCRWSMISAGFGLERGNAVFVHSLWLADILGNKTITRYFNNLSYVGDYAKSRKDEHPFADYGRADRAGFKDPANSFSVTLTARERFQ